MGQPRYLVKASTSPAERRHAFLAPEMLILADGSRITSAASACPRSFPAADAHHGRVTTRVRYDCPSPAPRAYITSKIYR
jgi:hypothetical protein